MIRDITIETCSGRQQTIEEKLEVLRIKINEIIAYINEREEQCHQ